MKKTYKDLSPEEERELVLLLGFFQESIQNTFLQMERWRQLKNGWDIQIFFIALMRLDEAAKLLKRFLACPDNEVWSILQKFRRKIKLQKISKLRNDIIHPGKISKLQDQKGKPLPETPIVHLGSYLVDSDEYQFGAHRIKVSDSFDLVNQMTQELKTLSSDRLKEFYQTGSVEGMIPFTYLHHFPMRRD